jgi:C4-dicarboxylate-specific signal transduction histidine kinase
MVGAAAVVVLLAAIGLEMARPGTGAFSLAAVLATGLLLVSWGFSSSTGLILRELRRDARAGGLDPDVPEVRSARARLAESESSLRAIDRLVALSLVSAGAIHEIKGSLAGIVVSAEYALRGAAQRRVRQALERILVHARHGGIAATRYLEHVAGRGREEERPVDLGRDLDELMVLIRGTCRQRGVGFVADLEAGVVVRIRPGELAQVILGLVRNALEAVENAAEPGPSPVVEIRGRSCGKEAVIEVADNGPGVPIPRVGRLFEASASSQKSTGLGLYLSKMIVERNGGALEYVPSSSGGRFRLSLPLAEGR